MATWKIIKKMRKKKKEKNCRKTFGKVCRIAGRRVELRLAAVLLAFTVCVLSGGMPAGFVRAAAARTEVALTAEENQAEVALTLSAGEQSGQQDHGAIKSLQLGFQVNILHGEDENYQVSFVFDDGLTGSVKQFSYQEETGLLQIYLSGDQNLCEGGGITLGKIMVESTSSGVTASIRVAENSLKTVNDAFELQEPSFIVPKTVQVTTAGGNGKQTERNSEADGKVVEAETEQPLEGTKERKTDNLTDQSGSNKVSGDKTKQEDGSETPEQEPLLRLVRTEKRSRFSLDNFSIRDFLKEKKIRIVLGIAAVAIIALTLGTTTRIIHNRKKKNKKWW